MWLPVISVRGFGHSLYPVADEGGGIEYCQFTQFPITVLSITASLWDVKITLRFQHNLYDLIVL